MEYRPGLPQDTIQLTSHMQQTNPCRVATSIQIALPYAKRHYTGSAIFMAMHILSSFSIKKNSKFENLLHGLIANDTITLIKSIYSIWPHLLLMTDFNLPWKVSQEARSNLQRSRPILVAAPTSNYPANHEDF